MEEIKILIKKALIELGYGYEELIEIEHPADKKFGDYSSNVAMVMAKKENKNPRELALNIKNKIEEIADRSLISKVEVAGSGFINLYLNFEILLKKVEEINYFVEYDKKLSSCGSGKTAIIDYSAPNIAKPFGIGHLRSTNIGQAIYNLYKTLGYKTIGDNHLGDWGTQFGKLITAVKKWANKDIDKLTIGDLERLYVKFHKESERDENLIEEGREWFSKLERGDKEAREIWQKFIAISLYEYKKVYELLGVDIDYAYGESFYENMLPGVIEEVEKRGIAKVSDGAKIIEFDDMPPAMIEKSNGTTTYFTRDMATIKYRMETWNPDLIVYEVGADQSLHFRQLFRVAEMMGWKPKDGFVHIAHGLIRWSGGKFSTRKGDTIHLSDVIDKAMDRAKAIAEKSLIGKEMKVNEREDMIKQVAIGAIKFNDLSSDPRKDVIFDWDRIMSLEGDSGPYLQYTYARCLSLLAKTKILEQKNIDKIPQELKAEEEDLLRELYKFEEKILESAKRFSPAVLAEFLLSIARRYNEFYGKYRIIDQAEEVFRVFLTRSTASCLSRGLKILGIEPVSRM